MHQLRATRTTWTSFPNLRRTFPTFSIRKGHDLKHEIRCDGLKPLHGSNHNIEPLHDVCRLI